MKQLIHLGDLEQGLWFGSSGFSLERVVLWTAWNVSGTHAAIAEA